METYDVTKAGIDLLKLEEKCLTRTRDQLEKECFAVACRLTEVRVELGKRQAEAAVAAAVVSTPKPKVYLFVNGGMGTMIGGDALAEDGARLGGHCSSNETWLKHDLGLTSDWHHETYREHYPDGYEVEWVDDPAQHEGLARAYRLNQEQPQPEPEPFAEIETSAGTIVLPPPANAPVGACG